MSVDIDGTTYTGRPLEPRAARAAWEWGDVAWLFIVT